MAFNGSGTFNRLYNWVQDRENGIFVDADRMDPEMDGMATALSTCITKDGQTTPTANIPMGGNKIINLANGVAATDAATVGQVPTLVGSQTFYNAGASGVALSIDWTNGTAQEFLLTDNATVTIGNGVNVGWYTMRVIQDATGGRTISWTGAPYNAGTWMGNGVAPSLPTVALSTSYIYWFWDGTIWSQVYLGSLARRKTYFTRAYNSFLATTAGVATKIPFDTVPTDPYSEWAASRWTPKAPGLYRADTQGQFSNASADTVILQLYVGGSPVSEDFMPTTAAAFRPLHTHTLINATQAALATSYVEAFFTSATGAGSISSNARTNFITVTRLGDAE